MHYNGSFCFSYTKAQTFADCVGHELPYGWEECYHPQIGIYYINHINSEFLVLHPSYIILDS